MPAEDIEQDFPNLKGNYKITSPKDYRYNCFAWAGGDTHHWWQNDGAPYFFWLHNDRSHTLESYVKAYNIVGYKEESETSEFEPDFEKVALYVDANGLPSHAARQKDNGLWTSKLGEDEDIEHNTLKSIEGQFYGTVKIILKKPKKYKKEKEAVENKMEDKFENFKNLAKNLVNVPKKEIDVAKNLSKNKNKEKADK